MDEKTKLYVFARKELVLIFTFIIVTALTSFVLGVKIGKNYSFESAGLKPVDRNKVDMLSGQEEMVEQVVQEVETKKQNAKPGVKDESLKDTSYQMLKNKIDKEFSEENEKNSGVNMEAVEEKKTEVPAESTQVKPVEPVEPTGSKIGADYKPESEKKTTNQRDEYSGRYTIQLGSHRGLKDAEKFADGFRIRGYNPIINEVNIEGKGVWYRVSLGSFSTVGEAKEYVLKEQSLFKGQDYVISRFD